MEPPQKRSGDDAGFDSEADAKRSKVEESAPLGGDAVAEEQDDFDLLLDSGALEPMARQVSAEPPEEVSRRQFVDRLAAMERISGDALPDLLEELQAKATKWDRVTRWRCSALFLVYVARSPRTSRAAFVVEGLPLLGSVLNEAVAVLERPEPASDLQEAGMWAMACVSCLRMLPIGRATMWEHRAVLGKPFDRLHRWCGQQKSALAALIRGPTTALCRRWRKQPKPAEQETDPTQKALRRKVVDMVMQGLAGIAGNSPASPAVMASPARLPPVTSAAEVEAALFARYSGTASGEYRQHARMLRSNLALPGNSALREGVLSGEVSPEELVAMNSNALAPDTLQEQRKAAQERARIAAVLKLTLKPPPVRDDLRTPDNFNASTAPPLLEKQQSSELSDISRQSSSASVAAEVPPMPPPPTPFRDGQAVAASTGAAADAGSSTPYTPEVAATPAPGQEDEDESALIQWLSRPI